MKIDRARFLLLTGALSAAAIAGCSSSTTTVNSTPTADAGDDATTVVTVTDSGTDSGGDDSATTSGDDAASNVDSATCSDTVVTGANACVAIADAGADGGSANFCLTPVLCTTLAATLKPKIAAAVANCLAALPSPCDETASTQQAKYECLTTALATACPDSTAAASCATACGDAGVDGGVASCATVLPGLTDMGTGSYITCVSESGGSGCPNPMDSDLCLEQITSL
jgi:hypothetical protein